jgi:deazaflavin-dependent oxidoreductase (nitroreductase family)
MARTQVSKGFTRVFSALHARVYKLSGGRLGPKLKDGDIVLLTTIGRKTGRPRTRPLIAINHDGGWVVVGSYAGHDQHPAWYLNLQDHPDATLRVGKVDHSVTARDVPANDAGPLWERFEAVYAGYRAYREVTDRRIPLVHLTPN